MCRHVRTEQLSSDLYFHLPPYRTENQFQDPIFIAKKLPETLLGEAIMGRTVESYRIALEQEIQRWKGFEKALRSEDKEAFKALMDACRSYASAGSNATQPILFEPMILSILLSQQKKIARLEKTLDAIKQHSKEN